jgi:replicative superfamily II helicase
LELFLPGIVEERRFEFVNPTTNRLNTERFPISKGDVAAETAVRLASRGPVLIFTTQTDWAESIGRAIEKRLRLAGAAEEEIPREFAQAAQAGPLPSEAAALEWLGADHVVTRLLHWGVGIHHGKLPDAVRLSIETDFRSRRLAAIVATTTLAQGVNLPVSTTIIHSVWRADENGERTRIKAREYWNIAGRTGRAGEETEGTLIHIV